MIDLRGFMLRNKYWAELGKTELPFFKDSECFATWCRRHRDELIAREVACKTGFGVLVHPGKIADVISEIIQGESARSEPKEQIESVTT